MIKHAPSPLGHALCNHKLRFGESPKRFATTPRTVTCKRCKGWLDSPSTEKGFDKIKGWNRLREDVLLSAFEAEREDVLLSAFEAEREDVLLSAFEAERENIGGTCRLCSCTTFDCSGCIQRTGRPCYWVEPDLCSACATTEQKDASRKRFRDGVEKRFREVVDEPTKRELVQTLKVLGLTHRSELSRGMDAEEFVASLDEGGRAALLVVARGLRKFSQARDALSRKRGAR